MATVEYHPNQFLIHAADVRSVRDLVVRLLGVGPHLNWIKLGNKTFGWVPNALELAHDMGLWTGAIMVDRKQHDVPRVTADGCITDAKRGADMMTMHCSAGSGALKMAVDGVGQANPRATVLGVTVLTSLDDETWQRMMGTTRTILDQVLFFVEMGVEAGLTGFVSSAKEAPEIHRRFPQVTLVTPGIRLPESDNEDQKRVVTPDQAIADGSTFLVAGSDIGRAAEQGILEERLEEYFRLMSLGHDQLLASG